MAGWMNGFVIGEWSVNTSSHVLEKFYKASCLNGDDEVLINKLNKK